MFEPIERFAETTDIIRVSAVPKPRWLVHKYSILKVPMKEGIFNIKLVNRPGLTESQREDRADGGGFDHVAESFLTVDANLMRPAISNKTGFVPLKRTIRSKLMFKKPHTSNNINISRTRNKLSCLIFN